MRPTSVLLIVLALLATGCGNGSDATSAGLIPDVGVETFDGKATTIHAFLGEPLVVNFWASWCAPCVAEMPDFEQVSQELAGQVRFLGIDTQDGIVPAQRLIEQTGVTYDLVRDPSADAFRAFGIRGMPSTFLVSPEGELLKRHTGPLTAEDLRALIDEHLLASTTR
ncbi:MAG TPA: TlpA disulfide reductase family protein [Nitriliruptorales bacterium]